jgi:uncharacterized protein YbjQ (UPF0145 family)
MASCKDCGESAWRLDLVFGLCPNCAAKSKKAELDEREKRANQKAAEEAAMAERVERIIVTTESAHDLPIDRRLDIVTAEVVIGLHVFKDIAAAFRDAFGGRSKVMQNGLRDARKAALEELRREAAALGADAVVAIDLDYSEISGPGKMLFLVASGTAVTLKV